MKRREFITLVGSAAAAWPLAAGGQQAMPVVGFLNTSSAQLSSDRVRAFRQGLGQSGYHEGRNVAVEYRWAEGKIERLARLATDLVQSKVSVIVATGGPAPTLATKDATTTIPIVFLIGSDPIQLGLVESFNRPGRNLIGVTMLTIDIGSKRLEILDELLPKSASIGLLTYPTSPSAKTELEGFDEASRALGRRLHVVHAQTEQELEAAFAKLVELRAGGLVLGSDNFFSTRSEKLASLAARYSLPTVFQFRESVVAGGLMSYGTNILDAYRLTGVYAGRILKGERPADLPVQQSVQVRLVINLKTAKALGVSVPLTLLGRADEVIE